MLSSYLSLIRFSRPIGVVLLFFPCLWALLLSQNHYHLWELLEPSGVFLLGAFLLRSAGCVVNDYWDRDLDSQIPRTQARPLAAGDISPKAALIFFFILLLCAFPLLFYFSGMACFLLVALTIGACFYPLAKRFFFLPQLILALVFNGGVLVAAAHIQGFISGQAWVLYGACCCWTLAYDTAYAQGDQIYDRILGLKAGPLFFGSYQNFFIRFFYALFILGLIFLWFAQNLPWWSLACLALLGLYISLIKEGSKIFRQSALLAWMITILWVLSKFILQ